MEKVTIIILIIITLLVIGGIFGYIGYQKTIVHPDNQDVVSFDGGVMVGGNSEISIPEGNNPAANSSNP